MREQLIRVQDSLQWQWWNYHEGMWNNYMLCETSSGYRVFVISWPTQWESSCIRN